MAGFCAYGLGTVAFFTYVSTRLGTSHFGPGFYLILTSGVLAAVVAVGAVLLLRPFPPPGFRSSSSSVALAIGSALAVGASAVIVDLRLPFSPLSIFSPFTVASGTAAVFAFIAVAAFPLIALRIGDRVGSWLLVGLAANEAIRRLDAAFRRFGNFRGPFHAQLSIGWWIEILAVALLVTLAHQIGSPRPDQQPETATSQAP